MEKSIKIKFNEEKLFALRTYAEQKGISVENELIQATEALFQRLVPGNVKVFLDIKTEEKMPIKKAAFSAVAESTEA